MGIPEYILGFRTKKLLTLVFIVHLLGTILAVDAVMTSRTSQGAIAWGTTLVMFPYVSVPAYWVFGRSKFEGMAEARREREDEVEAFLAEVTPQIQSTFVAPEQKIPEYEALLNLVQLGMTDGNATQLLIDGEETYDSILTGIAEAQEYVLVEFYIVRDDEIGRRLKNALVERASQNVAVYFVFDEIGSKDLPDSYLEELRAAGVQIFPFNTTRGWRNRFQLNFRNHRKIVVVDGTSAWIGGLNVGDDYLGGNPKLSPWRDTHMRIDGPAALQAQPVFLADWYWATRQIPALRWTSDWRTDTGSQVMIIPSSPAEELETAGLFFTHAINSARERIWISTPYFIPDQSITTALRLADFRGVDVKIIIPKTPDQLLVRPAAEYYLQEFQDSGIEVYDYINGFTHQKVMLVDNDIATIGTANFDIRSFRLNFEVTALVKNTQFALDVRRMLEEDIANSEQVDITALGQQSYFRLVYQRIARLFSPVL